MKLLVKGIGQLVTVAEGVHWLAGKDMAAIKAGHELVPHHTGHTTPHHTTQGMT
jgi:hypothetical protein